MNCKFTRATKEEESRLIIDFIRSLGSFTDPVVHSASEEFKNAAITGWFLFLFEISAKEIVVLLILSDSKSYVFVTDYSRWGGGGGGYSLIRA